MSRFRDLMRAFLSQRTDVPTRYDYKLDGWHFMEQNINFESDWLRFHETNFQLRLVCPLCHLKVTAEQRSDK